MGIQPNTFQHYLFNAGENEGDAPTFRSSAELSRSWNVENRGNGLEPRWGSSVLSQVANIPVPLPGNPVGKSIFGFDYGTTYETIFTAAGSVWRDPVNKIILKNGLSAGLRFQGVKAEDFFYLTNGTDPVYYYDPARSVTSLYTAGYDTPGVFVATPSALGGSMADGTYQYYATLFDLTTETESNRQITPVSAVVVGPTGSVALTGLPLDPESRSTHWRIYRKDPQGFYAFQLAEIPYNAAAPTYTDTAAVTGSSRIAPDDNFKPDPSTVICLHGKVMVYAKGNVFTWSKSFAFQNVPTYNREPLKDSSNDIVKAISYNKALVLWKTDSIYVARGDLNGGQYSINCISKTIGTRSPDSVIASPNGIYFLDSKGRPRFINSTDFDVEDLRDSTDISYKFRKRFNQIELDHLANCFAVLWETPLVSQYRLFVPVETASEYPNHCYVFDIGLSRRNNGDSAWFDFQYNWALTAIALVKSAASLFVLHAIDDYGLLLRLDVPEQVSDGSYYFREEGDGVVTVLNNTITISTANLIPNEFIGHEIILYDRFTYVEIFRSKIVSNTDKLFTLVDVVPALSTTDPAVNVGGYLHYFATTYFSINQINRFRPFIMNVLLGLTSQFSGPQIFTLYDYNETFNYTYDYINNQANPSLTPLADQYPIVIGDLKAIYDSAVYNADRYGSVNYGSCEFLLKADYLAKSVAWGIISRKPNQFYSYIGASYEYQDKGTMT